MAPSYATPGAFSALNAAKPDKYDQEITSDSYSAQTCCVFRRLPTAALACDAGMHVVISCDIDVCIRVRATLHSSQ
jgi:hypothetical protein